jgi:hypothetical protein
MTMMSDIRNCDIGLAHTAWNFRFGSWQRMSLPAEWLKGCQVICFAVGQKGRHTIPSADKFLARPTSRRILFDGENISFVASLVIYINSTNIPPIMIINKIYERQNLLSL